MVVAATSAESVVWTTAERRYFFRCAGVSAGLYALCVIFCDRYYHLDEYFQIVEFASVKLGFSSANDLAWEYHAAMRSWLQPTVYAGAARLAIALGAESRFALLAVFRALTGVLSWASLWLLVYAGRRWIATELDRRRLYLVAAGLVLIPFFGVRPSAETCSAIALCCAVAVLELAKNETPAWRVFVLALLGGCALGLCFVVRYTSGVMAGPAGLFYLYHSARRGAFVTGAALGVCLALLLGFWADVEGYGIASFPALSYFNQNFLKGAAASFGVSTFYAYAYNTLLSPLAPLMLFLELATILAWLRRPGHVLTWMTLPYVLALSLVGHKETRFLTPLVPLLPFFVVFAVSNETRLDGLADYLRKACRGWSLRVLLAVNALAFVTICALPFSGDFWIYRKIEDVALKARRPIELVAIETNDPANQPYRRYGIRMAFLEPKGLAITSNPPASVLASKTIAGPQFLAMYDVALRGTEASQWIHANCDFLRSTWPRVLLPYDVFGWQSRARWWMLYRCGAA